MSHRPVSAKRVALRAVAVIATAVLLGGLAGCAGGAESPGVTAKTIKVGTHAPLTGPAAVGYSAIPAAASAYFDYLNANGGVNGRAIEYIVKDDEFDPKITQKVVQELVDDDDVFAILSGVGTATHRAVVDYLNTKKVPDLFVASGSPDWNNPEKYPYTFAFNADYLVESKVLAGNAKETYPDKTYCLLGQDDDLGDDFGDGLRVVLGADGLAVEERYSVTDTDLVEQITALKAAGCGVTFLAAVNGFSAMAIATAAELGFKTNWYASSVGGDYTTLAGYLGAPANLLLEGFITDNYLPFQNGNDWVELFKKVWADYGDGTPFNANHVFGMSSAYTFAEALKKAGDDPSRADLVKALEAGRVAGTGIFPLTISDSSHAAYTGVQLTKVSSGVQAFMGSPYITSDGNSALVEYVGQPVAMPNPEGLPTD